MYKKLFKTHLKVVNSDYLLKYIIHISPKNSNSYIHIFKTS